ILFIYNLFFFFFFQAEDGIRDGHVTGVQTCALPIYTRKVRIVLAEKKIDFDFEIDDPWKADAKAAKLNPLGKVPALLLDDGRTRSEERRVGKECRARWWPYHVKKKECRAPSPLRLQSFGACRFGLPRRAARPVAD